MVVKTVLKFISVLGNRPYEECSYYMDHQDNKAKESHYVQYSILELLQKQGVVPDKIIVLTTQEAYENNWIKNIKANNDSGLESILKEFCQSSGAEARNIMIPAGKNEEELWEMFNVVLNCIDEGDEIILDITHSFRYIPMLTFIVLIYARIVKKCTIKDVYYGAYEAAKNGDAPIYVLTPYVTLFDWIIAVERYLSTGDAERLMELTKTEAAKISRGIRKSIPSDGELDKRLLFREPDTLRLLAESMHYFSEVIRTCRGPEITQAITDLREKVDLVVESAAHERVKPLSPIIDLVKYRFDRFHTGSSVLNAIESAKWCLEKRMYQQGFTILQEGLISWACEQEALDIQDVNERKRITSAAHITSKSSLVSDDQYKAVFGIISNMSAIRNDINHAGWRKDAAKITKFEGLLRKFIAEAEAVFNPHDNLFESSNLIDSASRSMLLILSHPMTVKQRKDAEESLKVTKFVALPEHLAFLWSDVPPDLDDLEEYLESIKQWVVENGKPGDYALVQGDFGATTALVNHCRAHGIVPVYATTRRKAVERVNGEKIIIEREFEHVRFRIYP